MKQFRQVAQEQGIRLVPLTDDLPLLECGLDSFGFAVVVARLEEVLGIDPFSAAAAADTRFPVTVGEFCRFYEDQSSSETSVR